MAIHRSLLRPKNGTEVLSIIIHCGANINQGREDGNTAVHNAGYINQHEALSAVIKAGAVINQGNQAGATPLCIAAERDSLEALMALIRAGADMNQGKRRAPRHSALRLKRTALVF